MNQSHCESPVEEGKDTEVMSVLEIVFEKALQKPAMKKIRHDVSYPAHTMPTGVSSLAYRQTSPGNMTQIPMAVIRAINTMMSL